MTIKRPQAPPFENKLEIEAFLAKPLLARFCSHNSDGSIHVTPIYYIYKDGEFLFGTQMASQRVKNIQRDKHVTVLIDTYDPVLQAVLAYGEAELDYEGVLEKRVKILERYYESPSVARSFAERLSKAWKTVIIHVRPTRLVTFDYTKPFSID
ncbi:MAG TPA: pyridoxamine 5'-phosphate oxidase family protein [Anaerolineaceae bacterium]|nr:pyridoxamine 5'-phosphate oxidase family protein [Anaerolineaceae bacterium]